MISNIFKEVQKAGTAFVSEKASESGFSFGNSEWSNLGQGAPFTGKLSPDDKRIENISIDMVSNGYAAVPGLKKLREKIANYYNQLFRKTKKQQFSFKNVCVVPGGRAAISRVMSMFSKAKLLNLTPDYAVYEELIKHYPNITSVVYELSKSNGFKLNLDKFDSFLGKTSVDAFLLSNPSNPTGQVLADEELYKLYQILKKNNIFGIYDEFYSHFVYSLADGEFNSTAKMVEDINQENYLIIDGLTKGWRYPGWRISWIVGPENLIENISNIGSFMDGGANRPLQSVAINIVNLERVISDSSLLKSEFRKKRDLVIKTFKSLGCDFPIIPQGALYVWVDINHFPKDINTGINFYTEALKEKLVIAPGEFFDIDPNRGSKNRRWKNYVRISYGPDYEEVKEGMQKIINIIQKFS